MSGGDIRQEKRRNFLMDAGLRIAASKLETNCKKQTKHTSQKKQTT